MSRTGPLLRSLGPAAIALALAGALGTTRDATDEAELDRRIRAHMDEHHIPGLAAAAVDSGRVVWTGTYGFADIERSVPVSESTPFQIASVSKTLNATILMSLWADGLFDLDDDINDHLPFRVRNPNHPDVPITTRHLLRHRSSVADSREFYAPLWVGGAGDPATDLGTYLRDYLSASGADYSAEDNFHPHAPGADWSYCNTCYALLGYLAERIGGAPYEAVSRERLFEPLGMNETGWFLRDFDEREVAMPYRFAQDTGYVAWGHNGYPDWPAGQLRTSIRDLARFLSVYAAGGTVDGEALIPEEVVDVLTPVRTDVGYHTWARIALGDRMLYQHGGGDAGVSTVVAFDRGGGRGVVVLMNGNGPTREVAEVIYEAVDALKAAP